MPKILFVIVFIAFIGLAACVGIRAPQIRGVTAAPSLIDGVGVSSGALVSNSMPAMAVIPSDRFTPVTSGVMDAPVARENSMASTLSARLWYALHHSPDAQGAPDAKAQLVSTLADLSAPGWVWSVNPLYTEKLGLKVLRQVEIPRYGVEWTAFTYIRPVAKDPWMPAFIESGNGWDGDVLVRQFHWWGTGHQVKVIVEYREAVPGRFFADDPTAVREFEERADAAFRVLRKEQGDALPTEIEKSRHNTAKINTRLVTGLLGEANQGLTSRENDW